MAIPSSDDSSNVNINHNKQVWISLLSGAGAGLACTLLCAPLDVAKVRLQIQGSLGIHKYGGGTINVLRTIFLEEGLRGVFRGVGPAMLTVPLFWGVYWPIYDRTKNVVKEQFPSWSQPWTHLVSAISAGVVGDVITNPFWVTRTRIQTLIMHPESMGISMSTFRMMNTIYRQEGLVALYKGLSASMLGLSHVAIQFPLCK
jgi:solute carrier family 25 folate transporter 32